MTNTFESMWEAQRDFTARVLQVQGMSLENLTATQRVDLTKDYLLSLHREIDEVLDNLDWKRHRRRQTPSFTDNVVEEGIDVQKFLWGLMAIWGATPESFAEMFWQKTFVVEERWRQEQAKLDLPILVVDIDGVLFKHSESFTVWLQENHPALTHVSKVENPMQWEIAKQEYRQSHAKLEGLPDEAGIAATRAFQKAGWSVVLMTYRPAKIFNALEYDTLRWLKDQEVGYDKLFWAAFEKHLYVATEMVSCTAFVEDDLDTCRLMASLGKKVYWVSQDDQEAPERIIKVNSLQDVYDLEYPSKGA